MKKLLSMIILGSVMLVSITGCGEVKNEEKEAPKEEAKGNCVVIECMKQLDTSNTLDEMIEIIGFEPEGDDYKEKYTWKLDSKNQIIVEYVIEDRPTISAVIDKETYKDEKVDLSAYTEMSQALRKGESYTYEELVEKVGGVEGVLAGLTMDSKRYNWVDKYDRTFSATINTKTGKASIISMR